jgi:hypothetical protein
VEWRGGGGALWVGRAVDKDGGPRMVVIGPCTSSTFFQPLSLFYWSSSLILLNFTMIVHLVPPYFHRSFFEPWQARFPLFVDCMNCCGSKLKLVIWCHLCFYQAWGWGWKNIPNCHIVPTILCCVITQNSFKISCVMVRDLDHARGFFMIILPQDTVSPFITFIHLTQHYWNTCWWILVKRHSKQS